MLDAMTVIIYNLKLNNLNFTIFHLKKIKNIYIYIYIYIYISVVFLEDHNNYPTW